ncbi:MAG: hypothetical protein JWM06_788 [Actinomycetia bacterium]|nr:hypothetical protein [Actinomycetes bacterium]
MAVVDSRPPRPEWGAERRRYGAGAALVRNGRGRPLRRALTRRGLAPEDTPRAGADAEPAAEDRGHHELAISAVRRPTEAEKKGAP